MVAMDQNSSDSGMWRRLRDKLQIFGRAVDGHTEGTARGKQLCKSFA